MISIERFSTLDIVLTIIVLMIGFSVFVIWLGRRLAILRRQYPVAEDRPIFSLDTPEMREKLRDLLEHYRIIGNCDIRDGKVYAARQPGERNSMAAALMGIYRREMERSNNPNLALYVMHRGVVFGLGLSLSDLRELAEMLEKDE